MPFGQQSHVAVGSLNNLNSSALQFRDTLGFSVSHPTMVVTSVNIW